MAATLLTPIQGGPFGAAATLATTTPDAVNGNAYANPGGTPTVLQITNGSGSPITVTFTYPNTPYNGGGNLAATAPTVAASATKFWLLEPSLFNNANGQAVFTVSSATTVTCAVYQFVRSLP
jgi:hypothetical protein